MVRHSHTGLLIQGWSLSLLLHVALVAMAVALMPRMTVLVAQEPFRWQVAVVEPVAPVSPDKDSTPAPGVESTPQSVSPVQTQAATQPAPPREAATSDAADSVMARVAPQQSRQVVHPASQVPAFQPAPAPVPAARAPQEAILPPVEPQGAKKPDDHTSEPVLQEVVTQQSVKEPLRGAASLSERVAPPSNTEPVHTAVDQPVSEPRQESPSVASAPPIAAPIVPSPLRQAVPEAASPNPAVVEAPAQVAKAMPAAPPPGTEAKIKADHRWLAELLWKRVAEFKQYPSSARLNGLEGKVVLKAVIRADGQLVEVTVQKSSGHAVLDAAAVETLKLATPLTMPQPLTRPEIVVSLPIVYSLSN